MNIKTILGLLAAGTVMVDNPLPKRLVSRVVRVIALVLLSVVLATALLLAASVYAYQYMTMAYSMAPLDAALVLVGALGAISVLVIAIAVFCARKLINDVPQSIKKTIPVTAHLGNEVMTIAQAFFRGLTGKNEQDKPARKARQDNAPPARARRSV